MEESTPTSTPTPTPITTTDPSAVIQQLQQQVAQLNDLVKSLLQTKPSSKPSTHTDSLKVSPPTIFDGNLSHTETFISQLTLYFHGRKVEDDEDRIITALSYMKEGTAGPWARLKVKDFTNAGKVNMTWVQFMEEFKETFGDPDPGNTARFKLDQLTQGSKTADEYVASFKELMEDTGYNDAALKDKFERGLNSALADKIYDLADMPTTLSGWMKWSMKLDRQRRQREAKKRGFGLFSSSSSKSASPPSNAVTTSKPFKSSSLSTPPQQPAALAKQPDVVPMEVDSGWKTARSKVCYRCRKPGHIAVDCRSKVDINSMDYDSLKAFMKEEIQKEKEPCQKKDF